MSAEEKANFGFSLSAPWTVICDHSETFWWVFVDKTGLQCCGQVLGMASLSAQHQCVLVEITAGFSGPLQGWAIRALRRFSEQQSRDMLSSWLKSIGRSACQSAQDPAYAVVTTNHSLCVSIRIS